MFGEQYFNKTRSYNKQSVNLSSMKRLIPSEFSSDNWCEKKYLGCQLVLKHPAKGQEPFNLIYYLELILCTSTHARLCEPFVYIRLSHASRLFIASHSPYVPTRRNTIDLMENEELPFLVQRQWRNRTKFFHQRIYRIIYVYFKIN